MMQTWCLDRTNGKMENEEMRKMRKMKSLVREIKNGEQKNESAEKHTKSKRKWGNGKWENWNTERPEKELVFFSKGPGTNTDENCLIQKNCS